MDDTVVSVLRGGFTRVERTLLDTGQIESVYQMRRSFQQAMELEPLEESVDHGPSTERVPAARSDGDEPA